MEFTPVTVCSAALPKRPQNGHQEKKAQPFVSKHLPTLQTSRGLGLCKLGQTFLGLHTHLVVAFKASF